MGFGRDKGFAPEIGLPGRAIEREVFSEVAQGDIQGILVVLEVELTAVVA